jgi:SEC-C motif domain protein
MEQTNPCPCQSGKNYGDCCQRYHHNTIKEEATPEGLMRSRYSAYALGLVEYLIRTTHLDHAQASKNTKKWLAELKDYCEKTRFTGLDVISSEDLSPDEGTVTFTAHLEQAGEPFTLSEKSKFIRLKSGRWIYHSALD